MFESHCTPRLRYSAALTERCERIQPAGGPRGHHRGRYLGVRASACLAPALAVNSLLERRSLTRRQRRRPAISALRAQLCLAPRLSIARRGFHPGVHKTLCERDRLPHRSRRHHAIRAIIDSTSLLPCRILAKLITGVGMRVLPSAHIIPCSAVRHRRRGGAPACGRKRSSGGLRGAAREEARIDALVQRRGEQGG